MGEIGSIIGLGTQIAGLVGGHGGGGGGGGSGGQTAQEAMLAAYEANQKLLQSQSDFGATGTGIATMPTWSAGGHRIGAALKGAGISDKIQEVQGASLQQLASSQGALAGQAAGQQANTRDPGLSSDQGSLGNEDTASLGSA